MNMNTSNLTVGRNVASVRRQSGFTLIELVIVLAVLGALAAIAVPQLTGLQEEAKINGTATVVSSELGNAFASELANGTEDTGDNGIDWTAVYCSSETALSGVSPALSSSSYTIGDSLSGKSVGITIPTYDSATNSVTQLGCEFGDDS